MTFIVMDSSSVERLKQCFTIGPLNYVGTAEQNSPLPGSEENTPNYAAQIIGRNMKNLGYANSWNGKTPEIVKGCRKKGHKQEHSKPNGRYKPLTKFECRECGYYYHIDSSG